MKIRISIETMRYLLHCHHDSDSSVKPGVDLEELELLEEYVEHAEEVDSDEMVINAE